jgi:molybdopterin converting factor small subunit
MTKVYVPTPLRPYTGGAPAVEVEAATVSDALAALTRRHPDLKKQLYGSDGRLRAFVNVYLNEDDVRYLVQKDATPVREGDTLSIVPSIAGGR